MGMGMMRILLLVVVEADVRPDNVDRDAHRTGPAPIGVLTASRCLPNASVPVVSSRRKLSTLD